MRRALTLLIGLLLCSAVAPVQAEEPGIFVYIKAPMAGAPPVEPLTQEAYRVEAYATTDEVVPVTITIDVDPSITLAGALIETYVGSGECYSLVPTNIICKAQIKRFSPVFVYVLSIAPAEPACVAPVITAQASALDKSATVTRARAVGSPLCYAFPMVSV